MYPPTSCPLLAHLDCGISRSTVIRGPLDKAGWDIASHSDFHVQFTASLLVAGNLCRLLLQLLDLLLGVLARLCAIRLDL
jgi:hypothetical protein